jgi:hypothetical protein
MHLVSFHQHLISGHRWGIMHPPHINTLPRAERADGLQLHKQQRFPSARLAFPLIHGSQYCCKPKAGAAILVQKLLRKHNKGLR